MGLSNPAFLASTRRRAVAFRSASVPYASNGAASVVVDVAGNVGDLVLLVCTIRGALVVNTPPGWTLVATYIVSFFRQAIFARKKQAGDVTVAVTTTPAPIASQTEIVQTFALAGGDTVAAGTPFLSNTSTNTLGPIPGTSLPKGAVVVVVGGMVNNWDSVDTLIGDGLAWQKVGDASTEAGGDAAQTVDCAANGTGAIVTVTDKTWTFVGAATTAKGGVMLVVSP